MYIRAALDSATLDSRVAAKLIELAGQGRTMLACRILGARVHTARTRVGETLMIAAPNARVDIDCPELGGYAKAHAHWLASAHLQARPVESTEPYWVGQPPR